MSFTMNLQVQGHMQQQNSKLLNKNNEVNDGEINKLGDGNNSNNNFVEHKKILILTKQTNVTMSQENALVPPQAVTSSEKLAVSQESSADSHEHIGEMVLASNGRLSTVLLSTPTAGNELSNENALPTTQIDVQQPGEAETTSDIQQEEKEVFKTSVATEETEKTESLERTSEEPCDIEQRAADGIAVDEKTIAMETLPQRAADGIAVDEKIIAMETPPSGNPSPNKAEAVCAEGTSTMSKSRPPINTSEIFTVWKVLGTVVWFLWFISREVMLNVLQIIRLVNFVRSLPNHFYRSRYAENQLRPSLAKEIDVSHEECVPTPSDELILYSERSSLFRDGTPDASREEEGDQLSQRQYSSSGVVVKPESIVNGAVGGEHFKEAAICAISLQDDLSDEYGAPISQTSKKKWPWDGSSEEKDREESLPSAVTSFSSNYGPTHVFSEVVLEEGEPSTYAYVVTRVPLFYRDMPPGDSICLLGSVKYPEDYLNGLVY